MLFIGSTTHKEACLSKHGPTTDQRVDARLDGHRDLVLADFGQLAAPEAVVEAFLHVTRHQRAIVGLRSVTYMYMYVHVHEVKRIYIVHVIVRKEREH